MSKFTNSLLSALLLTTIFQTNVSQAADADNSSQNKRDQKITELTAEDQSGSRTDVELTRRIREAIVKQDTFSSDAKNIKIITTNGSVTLKGPVNSIHEKNKIEQIAKKVAGRTKVLSQIEINKTN